MNISLIVTVIIIALVAISIIAFYIRKPKSDFERIQANLKKAERKVKTDKEALDKVERRLASFKEDLIKKNDMMLKEMQQKV